jgi:hypothetical protein
VVLRRHGMGSFVVFCAFVARSHPPLCASGPLEPTGLAPKIHARDLPAQGTGEGGNGDYQDLGLKE